MRLRRVCDIKNNQLIINLPDGFKGKNKVLVIVDDSIDPKFEKMALMKQASNDPLFLADLKEIEEDFGKIDNEYDT